MSMCCPTSSLPAAIAAAAAATTSWTQEMKGIKEKERKKWIQLIFIIRLKLNENHWNFLSYIHVNRYKI